MFGLMSQGAESNHGSVVRVAIQDVMVAVENAGGSFSDLQDGPKAVLRFGQIFPFDWSEVAPSSCIALRIRK
jgi:hypothetical protein